MKLGLIGILLPLFLLTLPPLAPTASQSDPTAQAGSANGASIFSWDLYLLNESAYSDFSPVFEQLNITRVYQTLPPIYLEQQICAEMVRRFADNGIEVAALIGEGEWGLPGSDLSAATAYIDALAAYNSGPGVDAPIRKLALDVETFTYGEWSEDPVGYFSAYITAMQVIYEYAHSAGLQVIQVIPVHFDAIDDGLFYQFVTTCCDELSLMNYDKSTQLSAIEREVALCRELDMRVETIFETMPYSEKYTVTEENTYFYEGFSALNDKKEQILQLYPYDQLTVSYHHLETVYHMITGKYFAEIYAYTDSRDPTRDKLGQTAALGSITLRGYDGSVIQAFLYNPNLEADYPEICYLAVGVDPDVTYTVSANSDLYAVLTPRIVFHMEENDLSDTISIRLQRRGSQRFP